MHVSVRVTIVNDLEIPYLSWSAHREETCVLRHIGEFLR
jgi:hypothetical protein